MNENCKPIASTNSVYSTQNVLVPNQRNYAHKLIQINLSHDIWNCIKTLAKPTNQNFEKFRELNSAAIFA